MTFESEIFFTFEILNFINMMNIKAGIRFIIDLIKAPSETISFKK